MLPRMHGESMIKLDSATEIQALALSAITDLSKILEISTSKCSPEEYEQLKRGVGLSIGYIQTKLLDLIYKSHPQLDDLHDKG